MSISTSDRGRVMIVDDDHKVLDLLVDLLALECYEISAATNGAEALGLGHGFEPDVVIRDVIMPVVGGLELCRRLKENERTANIPVLLISGLRMSEEDGIKVFMLEPTTTLKSHLETMSS